MATTGGALGYLRRITGARKAAGRRLRELEGAIYNECERLIPGVPHDRANLIRHRSSYVFWKDIIDADGARRVDRRPRLRRRPRSA